MLEGRFIWAQCTLDRLMVVLLKLDGDMLQGSHARFLSHVPHLSAFDLTFLIICFRSSHASAYIVAAHMLQ